MKKIIATFLVAINCMHNAWSAPSADLGAEWQVPAESSPGMIALVEKASGLARIALIASDGKVNWQLAPTGISNVSDVASIGSLLSGNQLFATSFTDNRVSMVKLTIGTNTTSPVINLTGIGTQAVGEGNTPSDILVGSVANDSPSTSRLEQMTDLDFLASQRAALQHNRQTLRLEAMTDPISGDKVAVHAYQHSPGNIGFALAQETGGTIADNHLVALAGNLGFVTDVKNTSGGRMIVAFQSGSSLCRQLILSSPIKPTSTYTYFGNEAFPFPIRCIIPVPLNGAGPFTDGVIATSADGLNAEWIRFDALGNTISTGHTFAPTDGRFFSGAIPIEGMGIFFAESVTLGAPANAYVTQEWTGSSWKTRETGTIPTASSKTNFGASVLFYDSSPFENENAKLLGTQFMPDWSSMYFYPDPYASTVLRESFGGSTAGLEIQGEAFLSPPAGTQFSMTNQVGSSLSISTLGTVSGGASVPDLTITPASGEYTAPFRCSAVFNENSHILYWRASAADAWQEYVTPIGIGYTRNLQFHLRAIKNGVNGPIVSRNYNFSNSNLNTLDSDGDGVPDYVEMAKGLNPFGGADSDGDGVSDLDEIVANTNPNDDSSKPATPLGLPTGQGFIIAGLSQSHTATQAATGEAMIVNSLSGTNLSRETIKNSQPMLPDGNVRYAHLQNRDSYPRNSLIALNSPLYFNLISGQRHGREMIRFLPADPPPALQVSFAPSGTNLTTDAANWISAAQNAASSYKPVAARTSLRPEDSAVAVLLEHMWHSALSPLRPSTTALPALENFSALSLRDSDLGREKLSDSDIALLAAAGYSFRQSLTLADTARGNMKGLADAIYQFHAINYVEPTSENALILPLPIDALRSILRTGTLPSEYTGAASDSLITQARNAYNAAIATGNQAFRPTATWNVEVRETEEVGVYRRTTDATNVVLLDENGERFSLNLGLGVMTGSRFQVTGFTDTTASNGRPTMEVRTVILAARPLATDRDTDCNLLDDEWELYFFGAIGQNARAEVNNSGFSLLHYFLDGIDPRGSETPTGAPINFSPINANFQKLNPAGYALEFSFPSSYASRFHFSLESSTTLEPASFSPLPATAASLGGNLYRFSISPAMSAQPARFYRVNISLIGK